MIYTSTSCLKNPKNIIRVLTEYERAGLENVELGSVHQHFDIKQLKQFNFNYTIHNYFPPPKISFNFNLASSNNTILKKSLFLAKKAIDLCVKLECPLYTFHAGFTVDPKTLGKAFEKKNIIDRRFAVKIFIDSVKELTEYAKNRGISIAMEPNVVQKFNLVEGKNELLLFAEFKEIKEMLKKFKRKELGILIDLGHTAVTSHWLNFNKDEFVDLCRDRAFAIHLSNNNGIQDQHRSLTKNCWQLSKLSLFKDIPIILETMNLDINKIKYNIKLANSKICN